MGLFQWWRSVRRRRITTGDHWEQQAALFLKRKGLKLLEQNYHCPAGEIDLVMKSGKDMIVFVEVRYRKHDQWANALESIGYQKQRKVIKAANHMMSTKKWHNRYHARFDVVAIQGDQESHTIDWIENAFH